jgi:hypothetical protein
VLSIDSETFTGRAEVIHSPDERVYRNDPSSSLSTSKQLLRQKTTPRCARFSEPSPCRPLLTLPRALPNSLRPASQKRRMHELKVEAPAKHRS